MILLNVPGTGIIPGTGCIWYYTGTWYVHTYEDTRMYTWNWQVLVYDKIRQDKICQGYNVYLVHRGTAALSTPLRGRRGVPHRHLVPTPGREPHVRPAYSQQYYDVQLPVPVGQYVCKYRQVDQTRRNSSCTSIACM